MKTIEKLDAQVLKTVDEDKLEVIQMKKQKNLEKMFKYQQRKDGQRQFKQRAPILNDMPTKKQKVE